MKKNFINNTRVFLTISAVIVVVALIMQLFGVGINFGIDFTGGSLLNYSVGEDYDVKDVSTILAAAGYTDAQITKAAPITDEIAVEEPAEETEVADEAADETETTEETEEVAEESAELLIDLDKSGIEADGLTDLQIRLNLVDETEGLETALEDAVKATLTSAEKTGYRNITAAEIAVKDYDGVFAGGIVAEFEVGAAFDAAAVETAVADALEAADFSVDTVTAIAYDAEAEAAAEAAEAETAAEDEAADEAADTEETEEPAEETAAEGTSLRVLVKLDDQTSQVRALLEEQMAAKYEGFRFISIDHVSAVAGRDLINNAILALLVAFAGMLIYIAIRFDVFSGLAALFALVHDVLVMCAFMVFFRGVFQVNSPFIAAVLTIVGYSINNTIVIFDRIRETAKMPGFTQLPRKEVVEHSVMATLSRTINTTVTTLITLVALYIFGVDSIREFAFPLIVGMLAGVYSSVLLSGQVWASWVEKYNARKAAKKA